MTQGLPGAGGGGPVEAEVPAGTYQIRQITTYTYQPGTNTFAQTNTEVVAMSDPITGLTVRLASAEQMEDLILLMRANLKAHVALLNEISGRETEYDVEDFMTDEGED